MVSPLILDCPLHLHTLKAIQDQQISIVDCVEYLNVLERRLDISNYMVNIIFQKSVIYKNNSCYLFWWTKL